MPPRKSKKVIEEDMDGSGVKNYYKQIPKEMLDTAENPNFHLTHINLPFRMCIVSASGGGKTNFLCELIHRWSEGNGTFSSITIITKNKDEAIYKWLASKSDQIRIVEGLHNTPKLDDMDKKTNSLCVWDDLVLSKDLSSVENYFIRARKMNCSCIFISQSYFLIPPIIRKNITYLVLLKLNGKRDINAIMSEAGIGVSKDALVKIYQYATSVRMCPLLLDLEAPPEQRFRRGILEVINPNEYE
jgi:hypothetical protein